MTRAHLPWTAAQVLPWRAGLAYGLLGLPLAFAALPLYVVLPHYYASDLGLPLATVGVLFGVVAFSSNGLGMLLGGMGLDRLSRTSQAVLWVAGAAALLLALGLAGLFLFDCLLQQGYNLGAEGAVLGVGHLLNLLVQFLGNVADV